MKPYRDDGHCFVCGEKNPHGLRIEFRPDAKGGAVADVTFPAHLQGWESVVHGGMIATVLDEMLIKAAGVSGYNCITAEITVKYVSPAKTGVPYRLKGRSIEERGPLVFAESALLDETGKTVARASGKLFKI